MGKVHHILRPNRFHLQHAVCVLATVTFQSSCARRCHEYQTTPGPSSLNSFYPYFKPIPLTSINYISLRLDKESRVDSGQEDNPGSVNDRAK